VELPQKIGEKLKGMQGSRCYRDQDDIIKKCPEQILPNRGHGGPT